MSNAIDAAEREVVECALRWHAAIIEAPRPKGNPAWWDTKRAANDLRTAVAHLNDVREKELGVRTLPVKKLRRA